MSSFTGNNPLDQHDPELFGLIQDEEKRQRESIELIASENFTSASVMTCLGSCLTNKYAEGYPEKRYYGGNEVVDQIENLAIKRTLEAFGIDGTEWSVNVQPYSGSPANFAVYTALLKPHDRIMGLDLPSGGHLTHGFYTVNKADGTRKAVSATSLYFESLPYRVNGSTGIIDYDGLEAQASLYKPSLIVMGGSAYPREWDYKRFRKIADDNGAILMMDMAHIAGLVATGNAVSPFDYADIVTTTTHKSLRGPRSGLIFFKKNYSGNNYRLVDVENKINQAVFPGLQGGPHVHQIAAIATQMKEVKTEEFKKYSAQVIKNCQALANHLIKNYNYTLATNGTDNHLILWDLKPQGLTGSKMQTLCDNIGITLNKNAVLGDLSALSPGGVRIGTPALTTRGLTEKDFETIGDFLHEAVQLGLKLQEEVGSKSLKDFEKKVKDDERVKALREKTKAFIINFPMPGVFLH